MLAAGTKIGSYEIVNAIGSGGMGEVYRGRDAALHRDVAIKILPETGSGDTDRVARFAREARVLASLSHPNIAAIYGFEQSGARRALVLELVEGDTLAARIDRGPMPLREALRIARDIADALDAAHEKGIVHRDLKPANVMLTREGVVKVLDFGVAKAVGDGRGIDEAPAAVTETGTRAGVLVGSPAYMSPEQMRGEAVDRRCDLWAMGAVLFEMLSGRRVFAGATVSDAIALVLGAEPDWTALPAATPPGVRHLLERCLDKNPKARWRDAGDLRIELDAAWRTLDGSTALQGRIVPAAPRSRWRERIAWTIAGAAVLAAAAAVLLRPAAVPAQAIKFQVFPPRGTMFPFEGGAPWPSISPDGRQLAFVAVSSNADQQLWVRTLDQADARPIRGTTGAYRPFWSPDSQSLAYFNDGRLWRVDLPDGAPRILSAAPYSGDLKGVWGRDVIVLTLRTGFFSVPATGGTATLLTGGVQRQEGEIDLDNMAFLPDGRRYLYLVNDRRQQKRYHCAGSVDPMPHTCGIAIGVPVRYAEPGYLLFVQDGVLRAQAFDSDKLQLSGEAIPVSDTRISTRETWYALPFSASSNGVLAYHPNTGETRLGWFTRSGTPDGVLESLETNGEAHLSPDGERLLFGRTNPANGELELWLHDISRNRSTRFTFDPSVEARATFSADSKHVVFRANREGQPPALYVKDVGGADADARIAEVHRSAIPKDWSSDNRFVLYQALDPKTGWDLWVAPVSGGGKPFPAVNSENGEREGRFAPGGKWIAYDSTESGRREIWVQPFPPTGARWQVSTGGGFGPRWRRDGKELFYVATDGRMMAIPITLGATLEFDAARTLFQTMLREATYGAYDVAADGQRFLINLPPDGRDAKPITVVTNWTAGLPR